MIKYTYQSKRHIYYIPYATVAQLARRVKKTCLWQVFSQSGQDLCVLAEEQLIRIKIKIGVHTPNYAIVAQLEEQLIRNQQVAGSSPADSSIKVQVVQCVLLKKGSSERTRTGTPEKFPSGEFLVPRRDSEAE